MTLRDGGPFVAWCAQPPVEVKADGAALPFTYDASSHLLTVTAPTAGTVRIRLT